MKEKCQPLKSGGEGMRILEKSFTSYGGEGASYGIQLLYKYGIPGH